ncbi:MAG TPA: aspartate/glutamate racemase family protein [Candidatus Borkfalkia faecigallinarum]|uniref:Aspartate/glutamate racemase family protein n=1 Tax=Candidatus Borkfalkia faecigallinarum TaxID=2838509 RepID=A0A9D1VUS5_9FIRM|nr:aspartate/glutamate racemase family protein [Candidatus Borkfalkia faecigallinarum]
MEEEYVAFFDSGVGGLTLLSAFCHVYPGVPALYFGDNANAPYGGRPAGEIRRLVFAAFEELARFPVRAAVVACNTATAVCIEELRRRFPFPVVGVEPALRPAAESARGGRLLLLCTRATFASGRMRRLLAGCPSPVVVRCPARLAAAVDANALSLASLSVGPFLPPGRFAAAVLGCTHYVWLRRAFSAALGCPVYDGTAGALRRLAAAAGLPDPDGLPAAARRGEDAAAGAGTADHAGKNAAAGAGTADHPEKSRFFRPFCPRGADGLGMADHCGEGISPKIGTAAHFAANANGCSKKSLKMAEKRPIFLGSGGKFNEIAYDTLQIEANICSYFLNRG